MSGDFLLKVSIRNNRILRRIRDAGYEKLKPFCDANKLHYSEVSNVIRMTGQLRTQKGDWTSAVLSLAGALRCDPEELFNERQLAGFKKTSTTREVSEAALTFDQVEMLPAPEPSPEASAEQKELVKLALEAMDPRQRDIVSKRYGLGGIGEHTLEEAAEDWPGRTGDDWHLSRERIRGIEFQALRKARARLMFDHKVRGFMEEPLPKPLPAPGAKRKLVVPKEEAEEEGFSWD